MSRRRVARVSALAGLALLSLWAIVSYTSGGVIFALSGSMDERDRALEAVRQHVASWGMLGPCAYVLLVIVEVLVAPIPGLLLYAPGGALFGGFLGGTLSLAGNAIGAAVACVIARLWREPVGRALGASQLAALSHRLAERGLWLILLLRLNPLTSSDLVSYAAGLVGVAPWKVFAGTLVGMAPLCYVQAYLADRFLRVLPGSGLLVVLLGVGYFAAVVFVLARWSRPRPESRYT